MDQNYNYQPAPQQRSMNRNQFPPFSNIILVDSLEHALRMDTRYHSEMAYWDRYKDLIYRIYTDNIGGKSYMILDVKLHEPEKKEMVQPVTNDALMAKLLQKIENLEKRLEVTNGQYNVTVDGGTNATSSASTTDGANSSSATSN